VTRFRNWLYEEAAWPQCLTLIAIVITLNYANAFGFSYFWASQGVKLPHHDAGITIDCWFPFILFFGAFCEEFVFRFPLCALVEEGAPLSIILLHAFFASIIFGALHGSVYNITIQGVAGFLYCLLLLKCGGLQHNPIKALVCVVTAHFLFNGILVSFLFFVDGKTTF